MPPTNQKTAITLCYFFNVLIKSFLDYVTIVSNTRFNLHENLGFINGERIYYPRNQNDALTITLFVDCMHISNYTTDYKIELQKIEQQPTRNDVQGMTIK